MIQFCDYGSTNTAVHIRWVSHAPYALLKPLFIAKCSDNQPQVLHALTSTSQVY